MNGIYILLLALAMAFSGCAAEPPQTTVPPTTVAPTAPPAAPQETSAPVTQPAQPASALVDADWLNAHLNDDDLRIVYVGSSAAARSNYDIGHIPGSVYLTVFKLLEDESYSSVGRRGLVISKEGFEKVAGELGITNDMSVVIYGDPFDTWVARAFWTFKYYGHEKAYYLDGGISSWKRKYSSTINVTEDPLPRVYSAEVKPELRATGDYVLANLDNPGVVIHDNRARGEYTGETILEGNERGGHIRGAVFLEWEKALNPDGTFKPKEELKTMYEAIGITPDKEIIIQCQVGVRVSHTLLALKYILGYPNVRNYDGSWDEWANVKNANGAYKYPIVAGSGPP